AALNGQTPQPAPTTTTQAAPPMENPFPVPKNGCTVMGKGNLLAECPTYTCTNIIDDQMRQECMAMDAKGQQEVLNIGFQGNPSGLYPTPLTPGGSPVTREEPSACPGAFMEDACNALMGLIVYTSGLIGKDRPPEEPRCCAGGIRG